MNYYVCGHQHKGKPFHRALRAAGHKPLSRHADVALFDRDWYMHNDKKPRQVVVEHLERGAAIFIYPHSALPPWWYDGLIKVQPYVRSIFVIGEGQKEAMQIIDPTVRVDAIGWPWCSQRPFAAPREVRQITFAPIHPAGGVLRSEAYDANRAILRGLKRVHRNMGVKVVIRYIGKLEQQGLRPYAPFEWIEGRPDGKTTEIDQADVVIAEGTYMHLSVARGRPTIGINQHLPSRANKTSDRYTPHNWDKYGPDLAYPINFGTAPLQELIYQAISGEQTTWRDRFIGSQMDRRAFSQLVETLWRNGC
jgi:hypothetical protein